MLKFNLRLYGHQASRLRIWSKNKTSSSSEIDFSVRNHIGCILLNRPKQLNVLTKYMLKSIDAQLDKWEHDPIIKAVVIKGAGEKAFCAGGDPKTMSGLLKNGTFI